MLARRIALVLFWLTPCILPALSTPAAHAQDPGCGYSGGGSPMSCGTCKSQHCCPKYPVCVPKIPRLKYCRVCPKPPCNPCDLEGYGYYQTCWHPWPFPPNCPHCALPPHAAALAEGVVDGDAVISPGGAPLLMPGFHGMQGSPAASGEMLPRPQH